MKKLNDKKQVVAQISAAARLYKKNLVGKHFLYVFDGRAIEVAYQAKGFRHLTGVDTGLDAMSFYKKAVSGTLQANQIFFSPHHPYQLCQRKLVYLSDIAGMVTSECFMLENITTETQSFQFGTTDLAFVLCLNRHKDASGEYKSSKYIVESLRDEDGFAKSEGAYPVTHILSKRNDEPFYHEVVYLDERESIETLPPLAAELVRLTDEAGTWEKTAVRRSFLLPILRPVEAVAVLGKVGGSLSVGSGRIRDSGAGDAFIDQRLLEDLGADRGREAAARSRPAVGLVEADEAQKLGVVDGSHGHKAGDAGLLVGAVQLLAGAALAAYPVARDPGVPAAAVEDDGLHHLPHGAGGLLFQHLPLADGGEVVDDFALRAEDVRDDIGLHQPPAVDHGADRRRHLEVRDLAALPEGAGRQLHRPHPVDGVVEALFGSAGRSMPVGARRPKAAK